MVYHLNGLGYYLSGGGYSPIAASTVSLDVLESFESGNLDDWFADTGEYNVVGSPSDAIFGNGSFCLEKPFTSSSFNINISDMSSVNGVTVTNGDYWRVYFYADNTNVRYLIWWGNSSGSWYRCQWDYGSGNYELYKGSSQEASDTFTTSPSANTMYYALVGYRVGGTDSITLQLFDMADNSLGPEIEFQDFDFDGDFFRLQIDSQTSGDTAYLDHFAKVV